MATIPRLYVEAPLSEGAGFGLDEEQSGYLLRVLRMGSGDSVLLFNGRDGEWRAAITKTAGKRAEVTPEAQVRPQLDRLAPPLTLLFAPVKKDATDLIIEKATELGAAALRPVLTERTQTRTVRADRFRRIALEAAEQTERLDLPDILDLCSLDQALTALAEGTAVIFCDEAGDDPDAPWGGETGRARPMREVLNDLKGRPAAILTGPEGGFTPGERTFLRGRAGTYPVSLGPRILRAETAAISAMTLWQALCGDWG